MADGNLPTGKRRVSVFDVHEIAAADHADVGGHIVVKFAISDALREGVPDAVTHSLVMWWQFFDDMDRAVAA